MLSQNGRNAQFKPDVKKDRMAGHGSDYQRSDILAVYKAIVIRPVEQKKEFVFGMVPGDALQRFVCKPADAFQAVGQKQTGIYSNFQRMNVFLNPGS